MHISELHTPPGFEEQNRPHIMKIHGTWWAIWPRRAAMPTEEELERLYRPFLNNLNGYVPPQPTSFLYETHPVIQ
jgi:hypothetical protein